MTRAFCILIALAGAAAAQPKPDDIKRAAELYDQGKRHFDIAEYANAIAAWKEAYLLSSEPLLLFNIAQAHRLAGDCAQANRFYLNYKRVQPRPPNQAELESAMAKCAGVPPATGDTSQPATAEPAPEPPVTEPAPTTQPPVTTAPPPTEPPVPAEPLRVDTVEDRGRTYRLTGLAIAGAGGVAAIIGTVFAFRASDKASDVEGQRPGTAWDTALAETERDGQTAATNAKIFIGIGAAAIIGGGVLYFYGRSRSSVKVDIALSPQHSEVSLSCAF